MVTDGPEPAISASRRSRSPAATSAGGQPRASRTGPVRRASQAMGLSPRLAAVFDQRGPRRPSRCACPSIQPGRPGCRDRPAIAAAGLASQPPPGRDFSPGVSIRPRKTVSSTRQQDARPAIRTRADGVARPLGVDPGGRSAQQAAGPGQRVRLTRRSGCQHQGRGLAEIADDRLHPLDQPRRSRADRARPRPSDRPWPPSSG